MKVERYIRNMQNISEEENFIINMEIKRKLQDNYKDYPEAAFII